MKINGKPALSLMLILMLGICLGGELSAGSVPNGSFNEGRGSMSSEKVAKLRQDGWTCPDAKDWPDRWDGQAAKMKIEWPATGGRNNDGYGRISGGMNGYVNGYWGKFFKGNQIFSLWARGKGTLSVGLMAYKFSDDHKKILPGGGIPGFDIKVNSGIWVRYRYLMKKPDYELNGHPLFQAPEGVIDFDDVDILDSGPALDLIVEEENKLYSTGALIENLDMVQADEIFFARAKEYEAAVKGFQAGAPRLDRKLVEAMQAQIKTLNPYLQTPGVTIIQTIHYNDMIVMTRVLNRLARKEVSKAAPVAAKRAAASPAIDHKPGVRPGRPGTVTITDVRSNKSRYDENETARTSATIVNRGASSVSGTLIARMIFDLDTTREISRAGFSVGAGEEKRWPFSYKVGPETYGRAIEVEFVDGSGKTLDKWQEYYAVAAEYFRVHQHSSNVQNKSYPVNPSVTYANQGHHFGSEPTDACVQDFDAEVIISAQAGYRINQASRQARIDEDRKGGMNVSFYQNGAFGGQMGYEQVRQHPEYVQHDETGQFAVDPIYGGYPNPMELASPLEVGPKRKEMKIKPYLDREYTPWQHVGGNFANEEFLVFFTNCIKEYAKSRKFTGIFIDGNVGVYRGYSYDGTLNVPSGKYEDFVRLSARNHRMFSEILKKEDPNFGTWFNWGFPAMEWLLSRGLTAFYGTGSGILGDHSDENIRAATDWKNVMILHETGSFLRNSQKPCGQFLEEMIVQRDYAVQKYGASTIIGYSFIPSEAEKPGPSKWCWPTVNYSMSQLIATQIHYAGGFWPSYRPALQFMTRYSRFIWARDIKAIPVEEVDKIIRLKTPEKIWWRRLVYKRKTDDGYDLIVHLLRIPPTEKWDVNWADEPKPLEGVSITADIAAARIRNVQACRPYHFEEEQQVVQKTLEAKVENGKAAIDVPPFRYHTMVVFRIEEIQNEK